MSLEEWKIREELEREVENDLEREIKDEIYGLAMKLHKLYLHQRERSESRMMRQSAKSNQQKRKRNSRKRIVSEVNIKIKMEGGTIVEIKENKKEDCHNPNPNPNPNHNPNYNLKQAHNGRRVKFDWTQSLRSGSDNLSVDSKFEGKKLDKLRNTSMPRKTALLEMGWKC